ncbi:MAG: DsbA family protein [Ideonella sp.]|nr:DsbA family protein [Ideonella sp.]
MKPVTFWFDPISPYAWLAFDRLPQALADISHVVSYRPVLFASLLKAHAHKGPAEIAPKRAWTYRQVAWLARVQGTPLQLPQPHPFNPLALLRLALASAPAGGTPNRRVVELLFRHVWCRPGADPNEPKALLELTAAVAPLRDPNGADIKAELRAATEDALAAGVFGVPSMACDDRVFWGLDALPMLRAAMLGDPWFDGPEWPAAGVQPDGVRRPG